jgi:hypothetical protein
VLLADEFLPRRKEGEVLLLFVVVCLAFSEHQDEYSADDYDCDDDGYGHW